MRRLISLCLILFVLVTSGLPVFAQKSRRSRDTKARVADTSSRFETVRALSDGSGVLVEWKMTAETNNGGFYVYRIDKDGSRVVSPDIILGSSAMYGEKSVNGEKYSFYDAEGDGHGSYYIQSLQMNGKTVVSDTAATEFVTDLRAMGFTASAELRRQTDDSDTNGVVHSSRLQLTREISGEIKANRLVADPNVHSWVVAQPGVRIGVRKEGLYRVTKAELQAGGFNVSGDSILWQLYVEGVEQAITVAANADYIEFYGKGIDTPESDTRVYYLVSGPAAGRRIATRSARPAAGTVTAQNYAQTSVQKQRTNYVNQVLNGDAENYWGGAITTVEDTNFNFNLSGVDFASSNSNLDLKFQGYSFDPHIVRVVLNGETLASANGNSRSPFSGQYSIPTSFLREGANSIQFRSLGVFADFSFFDSISVSFARKFVASENRLNFYTQNYRIAKLDGFSTANIRVFDITSESAPVALANLNAVQNGATFGVNLPAGRGRLLFAVENSGLLQAVSVTANDPSMLGVATNAANLVIISYKDWLTQAEAWANYRRGQGFTVKVVEVSEIYDEFNYGILNSLSIRRFLQYAFENWQTAPSYVLLLGDASFDSRNYQGFGYNNLVPTHIVNTIFTETGSDDTLADFNNDGLAELAVGRIAGRNAQVITNAFNKVVAYEQAAPTMANRGVLFAYDSFDAGNNYDFQAISTRLRNQLPPSTPVAFIGRSDAPPPPDTPQSLLISSMNTGKYLVNYSGHGSTGAWASASFFSSNNVPQLTNAGNQSIYTMLTCLNGYFLHSNFRSLAENLVEATNGGAVAAWASTGETTPDVQEIMATRFFTKLNSGNLERIGDLVNDAKAIIPGGVDVRLSWALIGDPMLKIRTAGTGDRQQK